MSLSPFSGEQIVQVANPDPSPSRYSGHLSCIPRSG